MLWAELCLKYAPAFVILAQAHHLYTQRATLLRVADTARVLKVSVCGLTLLLAGTYFTTTNMPCLLLTYFWLFATLLLVMQKHTTSRAHSRLEVRCRPPAQSTPLRHKSGDAATLLLSTALSSPGPDSSRISG